MNATETKKNTNLTPAFALWKRKSKKDGKPYFSGKTEKGVQIRGFYNLNKKDLKEPDLRIYAVDRAGDLEKEELVALWCNSTKKGNGKILSGKLNGKRIVGFFNEKATDENNLPYIRVYFSEDEQSKPAPKTTPKSAPVMETLGDDMDLPF